MNNVKFMYNGIKIDGVLYKAWYSTGYKTESGGWNEDAIVLYEKNYKSVPAVKGLNIYNNSDPASDYTVTDIIVINPSSIYFNSAKAGYIQHLQRKIKKAAIATKKYGCQTNITNLRYLQETLNKTLEDKGGIK